MWLVRYDPRERLVKIGRGENSGMRCRIATSSPACGRSAHGRGKAIAFDQPAYRDPGQRSAVLIQQGRGGPIIAAERI